MANHVIRTGKLTDAAIVAAFEEILANHTGQEFRAAIAGVTADLSNPDQRQALAKPRQRTISSVSLTLQGTVMRLLYLRGTSTDESNPEVGRSASIYFDEFVVSVGKRTQETPLPDIGLVQSCVSILQKHATGARDGDVEDRAESATALLHEQFSQLATLQTEMVQRLDSRRIELESEFGALRHQLEEEDQERRRAHEESRRAQEAKLEEELRSIESRRKELDDRDHMHVRRLLRDQITTDIQARLQRAVVPARTSVIRYAALALSLTGAAALGSLAWYSLLEYADAVKLATGDGIASVESQSARAAAVQMLENGAIWALLARSAIAAAGAIAFLVYSISWLKRVYLEDVRAQRELERYSIDLNRASWAIETIMEAKAQGDVALPDILVTGVTRHLFDHQSGAARDGESATDAISAVLRASARAKIGPSGAEFELNNRGARKLAKELEE